MPAHPPPLTVRNLSRGKGQMTVRNLEHLFKPESVALIGASETPGSIGAVVARNLRQGGFTGRVFPVNIRSQTVEGVPTFPDVTALPVTPDLGVICTPPDTVPGVIAELGAKGTKAAVVITAGLGRTAGAGPSLREQMLQAARPHLLRVLGPNCLGIMLPGIGLNRASFLRSSQAA